MFKRIKSYLSYKKNITNLKYVGSNPSFGSNCRIIGGNNISIGNNFYSEDNLHLQTWEFYRGKVTGHKPVFVIGDNVSFMSNCHVSCMNKISIGSGCLFGDNVFVSDNFHGNNSFDQVSIPPLERPLFSKGPVVIGKNVWIGRNVCIMPNVTIGDNSIIGANSVVNKDVPENCIVAGNPARVVKEIKEDTDYSTEKW